MRAAAFVAAIAVLFAGPFAAAVGNNTALLQAKNALASIPITQLSRFANASWAVAHIGVAGTPLFSKLQVNNTALLPGQIICYYDRVSGIVTSLDDGSGPTCGTSLTATPVKLGGTKYVSSVDVQLVRGTPYIGRLTFWVADANSAPTTKTLANGKTAVVPGSTLPTAIRCGRVDDDSLDKVLDGLAHAESWPSAVADVEEALNGPAGSTTTPQGRKSALASDLGGIAASEGHVKSAQALGAVSRAISAPRRGRGLATLRGGCFSNVRLPVDLAEVADALRVSPLTGDLKLEWGWQNTSAVVRSVVSTPLTAANVAALPGNLSAKILRRVANKSAAVSALINDPARRQAAVRNNTVGKLSTLRRAFNKTRPAIPSVLNAATLRATFTDETLHQQVYVWQGAIDGKLPIEAAGGIPEDNSTFVWVDNSKSPPVPVLNLEVPPPVPDQSLPEGIVELPAGTDPACVSLNTCPIPPKSVDIVGGECVIMGAKYSCLAPGSTCSGGDVPQTDVAGTCPEGGVCCAPAPSPPPPPFVPDTPTPTTPAATAPPYPTNTPAPFPTTQPTPVPTPPAYECPFGLLPTVVPPTSIANCAVKSCNPCGSSAPDVYQTAKTAIYKTTAWTPSTPPDSNELQCYLDTTDPFLCSQASQSQNGACTTNDIAVDGNGDLIVLGRTGGTAAASGWVIRVTKPTAAGNFPCVYKPLLSNIVPWAGLGAAPKSNLLYGIGDGSVFTVQLYPDGTAAIVSQLAFAGFTGAGDITAAPGGLVYAISGAGKNAYQVFVDGNYYPVSVSAAIATTGSTYPAAFCTSSAPLAISSFPTLGRVSSFLSGFTTVGNSGQSGNSLTGAAVAPVC